MESVPIKNIRKIAEAYDKKLLANDPRFRREVTIIHQDGSINHYDSAFLMKIADVHINHLSIEERYWIVCFTEHHSLHIEHSDDLLLYWESERRHQPIEELT